MFKLHKPRARSILGMDISSSAVKILEISGTGDKLRIEEYGIEALPADALDGARIQDIDAVVTAIQKLLNRSQFASNQAAFAVPDSAVINKIIQIEDGLDDDHLEELVITEASNYIAYPIEEINLDFKVLGHSANNSAMLDVLLVASRAEIINSRREVAFRAGLDVKIVDVESYAIERAAQVFVQKLPEYDPNKLIAIIDIGTRLTHLFVLQGKDLIFSREDNFGSQQLMEVIAEQYKMPPEQAKIIKEQGLLSEDCVKQVFEPFKEKVVQRIHRTLQFFYTTSQYRFVDYLLLAGNLFREPGLIDLIREQTGVITNLANPFSSMSVSNLVNLKAIRNDAPGLLIACGLALRN